MYHRSIIKRSAQLVLILLCTVALKLFYSSASVNQLRWILAPTTRLVELITGMHFRFEAHAGYMSSDQSFLIAGSCSGVNFLLTAFLMLSLRTMWNFRSQNLRWRFIPIAALCAYVATIIANTVRISTALRLQGASHRGNWLDADQLHRFEGVFIYFGFLLLLFMASERINADETGARNRSKFASVFCGRAFFPLLVYYATTLGMPLVNGAYRQGTDFWEHAVFVLVVPLLLIVPYATFSLYRSRQPDPQITQMPQIQA